MTGQDLLRALILTSVSAPLFLLLTLGLASLAGRPLSEQSVGRLVRLMTGAVFSSNTLALIVHATGTAPRSLVSFGVWFGIPMGEFSFNFLVDTMSLGFAALEALICGIVAVFSHHYLHREDGFHRYFTLFAAFVLGTQLIALAGSVEVLVAGWEFLGLSSALLVGFFQDRRSPVSNALHVFSVYRVGDAAMLAAAVLLHYTAGSGSLALLFSASEDNSLVLGASTTAISLLLIVAVAAKSALLPFSGWLPRAMEGPTPSSAVYYGAVSIHAGCFLLLRAGSLLEQSALATVVAAAAGLSTAIYATICARVQADLKSTLAYGALTHVGLIVTEIAIGWYSVAFLHIVGHSCFRLMQFLSAPNVLHDLHELASQPRAGGALRRRIPASIRHGLYFFALERGFLDTFLDRFVVKPVARLAATLDRLDRCLCGRGSAAFRQIGGSRDE